LPAVTNLFCLIQGEEQAHSPGASCPAARSWFPLPIFLSLIFLSDILLEICWVFKSRGHEDRKILDRKIRQKAIAGNKPNFTSDQGRSLTLSLFLCCESFRDGCGQRG
jgi:hypothetical protein